MRKTDKQFLGLRTLALAALTVLSFSATAQEAFYVYQHGGAVEGFFYDEVEYMEYSMVDTAGVEFDEYVAQVVATPDSTYRFMLADIDSISFVQPEIRLNPNMRDIREEGIEFYLNDMSEDRLTAYFSTKMPREIWPKVGDVLVDFDPDDGWAGKVREVKDTWQTLTVYCDPITSINDVIEQMTTVEQYQHDEHGNMIRRRVAGMPQLTQGEWESRKARQRATGKFDLSLLNFSLSGHFPLYVSPEGDFTASTDLNVGVEMGLKCTYDICTERPLYIGMTLTEDMKLGIGVTLDGKLATIIDSNSAWTPKFLLPPSVPIFELSDIPSLFVRGDVHLKFSADLINMRAKAWQRLEFFDDFKPVFHMGRGKPENDEDYTKEESRMRDSQLELSGFVQAGVHLPIELSLNRWLSKILEASFGTHLYIGPKLSGALKVSFSDMYRDGANAYNALKNSGLTFTPLSIDYETKAKVETFWGTETEFTFGDGSTEIGGSYNAYLLPEFGEWVTWQGDDGFARYTIMVKPRFIFGSYPVGIRVYMQDRKTKELTSPYDYWHDTYSNAAKDEGWAKKGKEKHPTFSMSYYSGDLKGQNMVLRPIYSFMDMTFEASPDYIVEGKDEPFITLERDTVYLDYKEGSTATLSFETNATILDEDKSGESLFYEWRITGGGKGKYTLNITATKTNYHPFVERSDLGLVRAHEVEDGKPINSITEYVCIIQRKNRNPVVKEVDYDPSIQKNDIFGSNWGNILPCTYSINETDSTIAFSFTTSVKTGATFNEPRMGVIEKGHQEKVSGKMKWVTAPHYPYGGKWELRDVNYTYEYDAEQRWFTTRHNPDGSYDSDWHSGSCPGSGTFMQDGDEGWGQTDYPFVAEIGATAILKGQFKGWWWYQGSYPNGGPSATQNSGEAKGDIRIKVIMDEP